MRASTRSALLALAAIVAFGPSSTWVSPGARAAQAQTRMVPKFEVDPSWPKLPNKWVFGQVSSVSFDENGHAWVLQRPTTVRADQKAKGMAAPPVLEFDEAGNFIQGWGGPGAGYDWPETEHGVYADPRGFIWIGGNGITDNHLIKFTKAGKFVMQIGKKSASKGNNDTENVKQAADIFYYAKTNELFVADGYGNRRVIVFDGQTGKYKRMWSAFGNVPTDPKPGEPVMTKDEDAVGNGPQQFSTNVHSVRIANDGMVYVCDRRNQRIQVFKVDGTYVTQVFVDRGAQPKSTATGMLYGKPRAQVENELLTNPESPSRTTFSPDPEQRYLYVLARRYQKIYIYDRKTLTKLGEFGGGVGDKPGQGYVIHDMSTDSKGNFYVSEINENSRIQKFAFTGMKPLSAPATNSSAAANMSSN
jgi:hypothetical protein